MRRLVPLMPLAAGYALGCGIPARGGLIAVAVAALPLALSPPLAPLAFAAAGMLAAGAARVGPPERSAATRGGTSDLEAMDGRIASVPERLGDRVRFLLRAADGRLVQVTAPPAEWPLAWGDRVRLEARVFEPEGARNPGGRDPAALLAARGIGALAAARAPPVRIAPPALLSRIEAGRTRFAAAAAAALPPAEAALVRAVGAGDRAALDAATTEAFARSGLAHLLSVSGLHLAVVAAGTFQILRSLLLRSDALAARADPRRAAALLALPVAGLYALATGADVPVVRSALAAALTFAGALLDREPDPLSSLSLGLLAVLAADPGALLDVSLQLSFASVAGLALLARPIRAALPWHPPPTRGGRLAEAILMSAAASLAASLATAPLVAFHFRRLAVLAPLANLAGVPLGSALTVAAACAALAAGAWPPLAVPFLWCCRPLAWLLLRVNDAFAAPSWAAVGLASPGPLGLGASCAAMAGALALRGRKRAACAAVAGAALLVPGLAREAAAARRGLLEVVFVNVGQGDAALLRLPDGAAILVDGGGDPRGRHDPGARDLLPFLRDAGVRRLGMALLTHPHPDHALGMVPVLGALPADRFAGNGRTGDGPVAAALARLAPERLLPGAVLARAGVRIGVLGPPPGSEAWSENDASLVLRVEFGRTALLLAGDVEAEGEAALVASGFPLRADVVKVAHHGSATSSGEAFVRATRPRFAVISAGRHNPWGFPSAEVVHRWRSAGVEVLVTAEMGAIRFLSDGRRIWRARPGGAIDALEMWREGRGSRHLEPGRDGP